MNEQVLTTMTSASSALGTSSAPASVSMPIMTSLSTRFLGHPRLTNPTLGEDFGPSGVNTGRDFDDMQSHDSIIQNLVLGFRQRRDGIPTDRTMPKGTFASRFVAAIVRS